MQKAEHTGPARSNWSGRTPQVPSEISRTPAARALALQRTAGNRAVVAVLQRDKTKAKKTKNARLRRTQEEQERTYTLPEKRKGSAKKSQRIKHDEDYEKAMTKFALTPGAACRPALSQGAPDPRSVRFRSVLAGGRPNA
ncbi:MAG: hypothetical protein ABI611_11840 [Solirubrobacteraceae bacterium]